MRPKKEGNKIQNKSIIITQSITDFKSRHSLKDLAFKILYNAEWPNVIVVGRMQTLGLQFSG